MTKPSIDFGTSVEDEEHTLYVNVSIIIFILMIVPFTFPAIIKTRMKMIT